MNDTEIIIKSAYDHFFQRLYERYGLHISYPDYLVLCLSPYNYIAPAKGGNIYCTIVYGETKILAIRKERIPTVLLTALPYKNIGEIRIRNSVSP